MDEVNRSIRKRSRTRWETRSGTFSTASSQLTGFFSRHRARWNVLYRSLLLIRVAELWALDGRVQFDVNGRRWMTAVWISRVRLRVRACGRGTAVVNEFTSAGVNCCIAAGHLLYLHNSCVLKILFSYLWLWQCYAILSAAISEFLEKCRNCDISATVWLTYLHKIWWCRTSLKCMAVKNCSVKNPKLWTAAILNSKNRDTCILWCRTVGRVF